ncbi:ABC transporter substrate-binding protein [Methylobacterium terricola]|uniref:ABC transporter substrate-binding protein n=1 Tax=Methylobacterium terricola TaxID=2583531 RepID=A0A5C4L9D3_9HYPH|nr:ABC transporter substrate-binding protein [Methylobacterium terricola]TNC08374.1 ABC transporter substrate-binding protein [Methylobacterium terricola]
MDRRTFVSRLVPGAVFAPALLRARSISAAEPLKVGVFPVGAALPYFVALRRGYFAQEGLACETVVMGTPALIVQALVTGAIDATSNLVTLEGANITARRPNTLKYTSFVAQNSTHVFEQFVVRPGHPARALADLRGAKLFTSPGPANIGLAKAILAKVGLSEGADYQMQEMQLGNHLGALRSGAFDGGYTLEPVATSLIQQGAARRLEAGVIATYIIGNRAAEAYAAGAAVSTGLLKARPEAASRFARAWSRALADVASDDGVRGYLVSDMNVPPDIVKDVPLSYFVEVKKMTDHQVRDFQAFVDFGMSIGVVGGKVDVRTLMEPV